MKSSWITTLGGVLIALAPVMKTALTEDWHWIGDAFLAIGGVILGGAARDNHVSSEKAGVRYHP